MMGFSGNFEFQKSRVRIGSGGNGSVFLGRIKAKSERAIFAEADRLAVTHSTSQPRRRKDFSHETSRTDLLDAANNHTSNKSNITTNTSTIEKRGNNVTAHTVNGLSSTSAALFGANNASMNLALTATEAFINDEASNEKTIHVTMATTTTMMTTAVDTTTHTSTCSSSLPQNQTYIDIRNNSNSSRGDFHNNDQEGSNTMPFAESSEAEKENALLPFVSSPHQVNDDNANVESTHRVADAFTGGRSGAHQKIHGASERREEHVEEGDDAKETTPRPLLPSRYAAYSTGSHNHHYPRTNPDFVAQSRRDVKEEDHEEWTLIAVKRKYIQFQTTTGSSPCPPFIARHQQGHDHPTSPPRDLKSPIRSQAPKKGEEEETSALAEGDHEGTVILTQSAKKDRAQHIDRGHHDHVNPECEDEHHILSYLGLHPNIITLFGWATSPTSKVTCMALELMDSDLGRELSRGNLPTELSIRFITFGVLSALQHLHSRGVVHRDVKPSNVLLKTDARTSPLGVRVVLSDFGSAHFVTDAQRASVKVRGTSFYQPPEFILGKYSTSVVTACDIWSLGCSVFETFVGSPLFKQEGFAKRLVEITAKLGCDVQLRRKMEVTPSLFDGYDHLFSSEAKDLIFRMLTPNPVERPSAETLLQDPFFGPVRSFLSSPRELAASLGPLQAETELDKAARYTLKTKARRYDLSGLHFDPIEHAMTREWITNDHALDSPYSWAKSHHSADGSHSRERRSAYTNENKTINTYGSNNGYSASSNSQGGRTVSQSVARSTTIGLLGVDPAVALQFSLSRGSSALGLREARRSAAPHTSHSLHIGEHTTCMGTRDHHEGTGSSVASSYRIPTVSMSSFGNSPECGNYYQSPAGAGAGWYMHSFGNTETLFPQSGGGGGNVNPTRNLMYESSHEGSICSMKAAAIAASATSAATSLHSSTGSARTVLRDGLAAVAGISHSQKLSPPRPDSAFAATTAFAYASDVVHHARNATASATSTQEETDSVADDVVRCGTATNQGSLYDRGHVQEMSKRATMSPPRGSVVFSLSSRTVVGVSSFNASKTGDTSRSSSDEDDPISSSSPSQPLRGVVTGGQQVFVLNKSSTTNGLFSMKCSTDSQSYFSALAKGPPHDSPAPIKKKALLATKDHYQPPQSSSVSSSTPPRKLFDTASEKSVTPTCSMEPPEGKKAVMIEKEVYKRWVEDSPPPPLSATSFHAAAAEPTDAVGLSPASVNCAGSPSAGGFSRRHRHHLLAQHTYRTAIPSNGSSPAPARRPPTRCAQSFALVSNAAARSAAFAAADGNENCMYGRADNSNTCSNDNTNHPPVNPSSNFYFDSYSNSSAGACMNTVSVGATVGGGGGNIGNDSGAKYNCSAGGGGPTEVLSLGARVCRGGVTVVSLSPLNTNTALRGGDRGKVALATKPQSNEFGK